MFYSLCPTSHCPISLMFFKKKKKKRKELRIIYKLQFLSEINQCNLKPPFQFISALLSLINCRPHMCTYQHYTKKKKNDGSLFIAYCLGFHLASHVPLNASTCASLSTYYLFRRVPKCSVLAFFCFNSICPHFVISSRLYSNL